MWLLLNKINVMNFDSNGFLTADSLIASLVIIILIMSLTNIIIKRIDTVNSIEEAVDARILGENIAELIESTAVNGPGYYITYRTPGNISSEYYYVHINSSGVFVLVNGKISYSHLVLLRVSGSEYLRDLEVTMKPGKIYNISNTRDQLLNTWIIVKEVH